MLEKEISIFVNDKCGIYPKRNQYASINIEQYCDVPTWYETNTLDMHIMVKQQFILLTIYIKEKKTPDSLV